MKHTFQFIRRFRQERGQALPLIASMFLVLILFVGLGIDLGFAYITRAAISKATDAAAMAGIRNYSLGPARALAIAQSTFDANYNSSGVIGRQATVPTVNLSFTQTATSNVQMNASASVPINTYFIRVLPAWKTINVAANGKAQRAKIIMSLVLDRSGSMTRNDGDITLPPAVNSFINNFDDVQDRAALITFNQYSAPYDIAMGRPFKSAISTYVNSMVFAGGTFSQGGLSNGFVQVKNVVVAPGEDVVKVCVFFTDGMANTVQDRLNCGGSPSLRNFGGYDSDNDNVLTVGFYDPANGNSFCTADDSTPTCCPGVTTFTSAIDGTQQKFKRKLVTQEAEFRAVQTAKDMRAAGIIVYAIGLGDTINQDFLQQVANDPASASYVATDYDGEAVFAPDPSQLTAAFNEIADKILYRLTQ